MWLRSERRERRLRRSRSIILPSILTKKSSSHKINNNNKSYISTSSNKCNNNNSSSSSSSGSSNNTTKVKRLINRKVSSPILKIVKANKSQKISDDCKENCWIETTDVTLFEEGSTRCVVVNEDSNDNTTLQYDKNIDIGYPSDHLNQFGPINVNQDSNSSIISSSCCSCDAEGLSSSKHESKSNSNIIKCISECDSTTGFDSYHGQQQQQQQQIDNTIAIGTNLSSAASSSSSSSSTSTRSTEDNENSNKLLFDVIVPEVDSTTDLLLSSSSSSDKKPRDLLNLILPPVFYHNFPTPDITPSNKQFPCYNSLTNTFFDDEMSKNSVDNDNQFTDYAAYNSYFSQSVISGMASTCHQDIDLSAQQQQHNLTGIDQANNDLAYLSMNQTAIDNLKALSNFQTQNFINLPRPEDNDNFIQSVQQQLPLPPPPAEESMNNHHDDTDMSQGDIRLETDECMEIEEIDARQVLTWNTFDPFVFIKHLPPLTNIIRAKCPALPLKTRSSPEFTLVLDLDETLVHCSLQELSDASFKFPVLFQVCHYKTNKFDFLI